MKKCIICGKDIDKTKFYKFCSEECREQQRINEYTKRNKKEKKHYKCIVCGKDIDKKGFYKFCSEECKKHRRLEIQNKYRKQYDDTPRKTIRFLKNKILIEFIKKEIGCTECHNKELSSIELDFHHIKDKKYSITELIRFGTTDLLLEEIKKCTVVCANCHRKLYDKHSTLTKLVNEMVLI